MVEKYIIRLKKDVEEMFSCDSSGHDLEHLQRVMNLSLKIQEKEGGDRLIVGIASYLHDIHRVIKNKDGSYVSPKESLPVVQKLLDKLSLTKEQKEEICFCIENHENYNWNKGNVQNINALIVQDADNLDALGSIGIARCFAYGAANNIKMFDENEMKNIKLDYTEESGKDEASITHFYHKLFNLGSHMNTKTAKKMAKHRTKVMQKYVQEFLKEWKGEK